MLADKTSQGQVVIACDMTAIPADQRGQHEAKVKSLFGAVKEGQELPNGYAFRLPTTSAMLLNAAEFIANERLCCPFFNLALEVEPHGGPFWLRLTGGEGVKEFIKAEFPGMLD